jgi:hypothetical protein
MLMPASLFGIMGGACFVALFANVYKHGWHWSSVALGVFLTVLMASLAVPARRRTNGWVVRYWVAAITFCTLGVYRFLL